MPSSPSTHSNNDIDGAKTSAKGRTFEICAANGWQPPIFDCLKEEGPGHHKLFTFKAKVEIKVPSPMVVECIGNPQCSRKKAAEEAAEGLVWYLMQLHLDHPKKPKPSSRKNKP